MLYSPGNLARQFSSSLSSGSSKPMTHIKIEHTADKLESSSSESLLIEGCINCIDQCDQLLKIIPQSVYTDGSKVGVSIGAHVRHILDRFHCFFSGLQAACVDYDARKRDREIEHNLEAATFALAIVARRVEQLSQMQFSAEIIQIKESVHPSNPAVEISSTVEREMMDLITHSIHHLAIISLIAKSFGYQMGTDFGKAPSTIVYERA